MKYIAFFPRRNQYTFRVGRINISQKTECDLCVNKFLPAPEDEKIKFI